MKIVVLAAGLGTRTKKISPEPKPVVQVAGRTLLEWAIESFHSLRATGLVSLDDIFVATSPEVYHNPAFRDITRTLGVRTIMTESQTTGPATTALFATEYLLASKQLEPTEPLVFSDCDHYVSTASMVREFERLETTSRPSVLVFEAPKDPTDLSWSFVVQNTGGKTRQTLVEKPEKVSSFDPARGVIGIYGFSQAHNVHCLSEVTKENSADVSQPKYMSELVNLRLEEGDSLTTQEVHDFVPLGNERQILLGRTAAALLPGFREPPTFFLDIDGTLAWHDKGYFSKDGSYSGKLDFLGDEILTDLKNLADSGAKLILTSSRPESQRDVLETAMSRIGVRIDGLILGITGGPRFLVNDSKPGLVALGTSQAFTVERNSGDIRQALQIAVESSQLRVVSEFPGESGSVTQQLVRPALAQQFIRKVSQPTPDSRSLIAYQSHWYRHVGQIIPSAVPRVLGENLSSGDSRFSVDLELKQDLVEFAAAIDSEQKEETPRLIEQFVSKLTRIYEIHRDQSPTPLLGLEGVLTQKSLPGLQRSLSELSIPVEGEDLPLVFNGAKVKNPLPIFRRLLLDDCRPLAELGQKSSSFQTLIHGDPTLSNIMVDSDGEVILLDPIGARVLPTFRYNSFDLGRSHVAWDRARVDLSALLGYEEWAKTGSLMEETDGEFKVDFLHTPNPALVEALEEVWEEWCSKDSPDNDLVLALTLARILPYKIGAGKKVEAMILLGFLGTMMEKLEL